ncbi:MAG: hypothetical protein R8K46_00115 [Mariprofundaceae bacterium]
MYRKRLSAMLLTLVLAFGSALMANAAEDKQPVMLFHLKTSLSHDDAQICVAYNEIWAALEEGLKVKVLVDADAANTFKIGWRGKDDIQGFKLPENLRQALAKQFSVLLDQVPETYGSFLEMLHTKGAEFYINSAFLVVAKIEDQLGTVENISAKFFIPISLKEMIQLRTQADYYIVY